MENQSPFPLGEIQVLPFVPFPSLCVSLITIVSLIKPFSPIFLQKVLVELIVSRKIKSIFLYFDMNSLFIVYYRHFIFKNNILILIDILTLVVNVVYDIKVFKLCNI